MDGERLLDSLFSQHPWCRDALCVALVGSQATGWRHALSDLDLLVVTDAPIETSSVDHQVVALTHPDIAVTSCVVDDMGCEAKCWRQGQVV